MRIPRVRCVALNDWAVSRAGDSLDFLASATNPIAWNTFYNPYFDADAALVGGDVSIDQARLGPGDLFVAVPTSVPGLLGNVYLVAGCGSHAQGAIYATRTPSAPNPGYAVVVFAQQPSALPVGVGCSLYVDNTQLLVSLLVTLNFIGKSSYALPIPAALPPTDLAVQAIAFYPGGPFLGWGAHPTVC